MKQYSSGPWKIDVSADAKTWENTYRIKSENNGVAIIVGNEANARLIAAAPEMFEVLEQLLDEMPEKGAVTQSTRREALDIIDKAKGGE